MARGINKVILIGNLGADPETRAMPSGTTVANLRIATSESWRDKQTGEQQERTEWHRVAFFGRLAEVAGEGVRGPCEGSRKVEFPFARPMSRRYFIKTFGCQMNEYDSARMADVLRAGADLLPTDDPLEADLLLMNTCSVREKAQEKVFSLLGEWRLLKARRPQVIIGVGGCVASQEGTGITEPAPFGDLGVGPQTLYRLPQVLVEL